MANTTVYDKIRFLQQSEEDICAEFSAPFTDESASLNRWFATSSRDVFLREPARGASFYRWFDWSLACPPSRPQMLCIQPTLIVDVLPIDEKAFLAQYGLTVAQFTDLACNGFIIPNLVADSDLRQGRETSLYNRQSRLSPIFDFYKSHCRINGIRRRRLFELSGYPQASQQTFY